ncbi:hypothetical protein IU459_35470 [Nocardia amamiensis]|uniref:Uncharacterized protein n=1 Tax=Nocardia amamiensis TaxID=404578 RepID=A0ABS0D1Y5_9NOCA|nr:hypothetical protein [Nocardia amamiensis]MBF6302796.1 hypothetical protein [Nocardia amamiensis]
MSHLQPVPHSDNGADTGLAGRLRPQFAQPIIVVDPDDPVMGGPRCLVPVCDRLAVIFGKCSAHHQRWIDDGRPDDIDAWAVTAPATRRWLQQPPKCAIATCRRYRARARPLPFPRPPLAPGGPSRSDAVDRRRWRTAAASRDPLPVSRLRTRRRG